MKIKGYSGIVLSEDMHHLLTLEERRMNYNKKKWKAHCVLYAELHDYIAVDFRSTRKIDLIP